MPRRGAPAPLPAPDAPRWGAVLLDLDGCLLDSNGVHARAWSAALGAFGWRASARAVRPHIGKGGKELLLDFVPPMTRHFLGGALGATQVALYLRSFRSVRSFRGAAAAVRGMARAGIPVVLASSAAKEVVERSVAKLRLRDVLTGWTTADDVDKAKPYVDVFGLAVERYRLARRRPVAVGDTPYDIASAHQMGLPCIGLLCGGSHARLLARADHVFPDLAALWRDGRRLFAP